MFGYLCANVIEGGEVGAGDELVKVADGPERLTIVRQAMRNYGYRLVSTPDLVAGYGAEQPVRLAVDPVGEVEDIGTAVVAAHPELDRPQAARG